MAKNNNDSGGSSSGSTNRKSPAERAREAFERTTTLSVASLIAAVTVVTLLAVVNGVFGGPALFGGFLGLFGFEIPGVVRGPLRGLVILAILVLLSFGPEVAGLKTTAPFWIGISLMALIFAKFILPGWVTGAFTFLQLGEIFLGMPLSEINVGRTVVLGLSFIFLYYVFLIRVKGAMGKQGGSKNLGGVLSLTRMRFKALFRKYVKVAVAIAGLFGILGFFMATGAGQATAQFVAEAGKAVFMYPVWSGYLATLGTWFANSALSDLLPFTLGDTELAFFFAFLLGITLLIYTDQT